MPDRIEEGSQLVRFPEGDLACQSGAGPGRFRSPGNVDRHEVGVDGVSEHLVEDRVDVPDGLRTQASRFFVVPVGQQLGIEPVEHRRRELSKLSASQAGEHVEFQVPSIGVEGARFHSGLDRWQPLATNPL